MENHIELFRQGVEHWNTYRKDHPDEEMDLSHCYLECEDYERADLINTSFAHSTIYGGEFAGAFLKGTSFHGAELIDVDFTGVQIHSASFIGCKAQKLNLSHQDLSQCSFWGSDLSRANFNHSNLSKVRFMHSNLYYANFSNAILTESNLFRTNLCYANFEGANLTNVELDAADLKFANLKSANLQGVNLTDANLRGTDLTDTNLSGAYAGGTNFSSRYLSHAKNIHEIHHRNSSYFSESLLAENYNLPLSFWKGLGFPDWRIESLKLFNPNLIPTEIIEIAYKIDELRSSNPIQIIDLFISYSQKDEDFVNLLEEQLDKSGIRFWRDKRHATSGPLENIIVDAMGRRIVLFILSKNSVKSDWCEWEFKKARELEKLGAKKFKLCPISLDDSWQNCEWPDRLKDQLRKHNILDFSCWKDGQKFSKQYQKLIKGLQLYYINESP